MLKAFASFGFCKAHAAAFALPTYQSAWLKAHHPAAFLAGVLTHDPGMYPKRLILDDARQFGIAVLPLDVNLSDATYRVEKVGDLDEPPPAILGSCRPRRRRRAPTACGRGSGYGIRLGAGRRQGHQRGRGRADRRRPSLRARCPTSGTAPRCPARSSSGWCSPARSTRSTASGSTVAGRPAAAGR